jgi:hypothetical protein
MSQTKAELLDGKSATVNLKNPATADNSTMNLVLQTGETDIAANDVIGKISFQAPDEGTGTDAILVAAGIQATSEGDFSSSANATKLEFLTAASEAASSKMRLSSAGNLEVDGGIDIEGGAVFNEDSADVDFRVESNGLTHAVFVDGGNDRVGFITTPDLGNVHIRIDDTGASSSNDADELVLEKNGAAGLSILSANDSQGNIFFGDDGDNDIGRIIYNHNNNRMSFRTNATEALAIDSTGAITKPLQPAFHAKLSSNMQDMSTGAVDIAFATEVFDQNADYNTSNYTFTAPVQGRYFFQVNLELTNIDNANDYMRFKIITSNRTIYQGIWAPDKVFSSDGGYYSMHASGLFDMDASDTCKMQYQLNAGAAQTDTLGEANCTFTGFLAC